MLALAAVAAMVALVTIPFKAEEGEFLHALRNDEIASVAVGHSADFFSNLPSQTVKANEGDDIAVSWVNRFGFRREAVLSELKTLDDLRAGTGTADSPPQLDPSASIVTTARSLGAAVPEIVGPDELTFDRFKWLSWIVTVLMIGLLVSGPQPRRMTKWGAFWAYLAPFHIGIFYSLLRDWPRDPKMSLLPEPRPGDRIVVDPATNKRIRRLGGGTMLFWSIFVSSLVVSLVASAVVWALPSHLDPVVWKAVDMAGVQITTPSAGNAP